MDIIRAAFESWRKHPSKSTLLSLLEATQRLVFGVCFEVLRHRHDAEDAAQRALIEIQEGLERVHEPDHFLRRARLVSFHIALDVRRDQRRRLDREKNAADAGSAAPLSDDVREAIHEAMAALDDESRALVIEHYFEKATLEQMGARRGVSGAAVWKRIEGIKGRLRDALAMAGLVAAASKADACLESATLVSPPVPLVNAAMIGGGAMAAKMSTATAAALVAILTFALGLGGGLAIQAARPPQPSSIALKETGQKSHAESAMPIVAASSAPAPPQTRAPSIPSDSTEDRFKLPREIWAQFSRPRFYKDKEARDETLPKLNLLGPEHAGFFMEKFRDASVDVDAKKKAVQLAVTCGGSDAAALLLELAQAGTSKESRDYRLCAHVVLNGESPGGLPEIPFNDALKNAAMPLLHSESGWDRSMALSLLAFGEPALWKPFVKNAAMSDRDGLMRSEAIALLVLRADADNLNFLRTQREGIRTMAVGSPGTELEFAL